MFKVVTVDWADNTVECDYGLDIGGALGDAKKKSMEGNTDYVLVFQSGLPRIKFEDGEEVKL